jgi:hypothetical protein
MMWEYAKMEMHIRGDLKVALKMVWIEMIKIGDQEPV